MPPKKRVHSSRPAKKKTGKTLVKKKTRKKSPGKRDKTAKQLPPDILNPAAMENLHYIAYNAPEALEKRGFGWTGAPKKKGKKKGKRGKKIKKK